MEANKIVHFKLESIILLNLALKMFKFLIKLIVKFLLKK